MGTFPGQAEYAVILGAAYTLTSTTNKQQLFNATTNGALLLPVGTYFFECLSVITAMSSTSGNAAFDLLGNGTATVGDVLYQVVGIDVSAVTGTGARSGSFATTVGSAASMVGAAGGTALGFCATGSFKVTAVGTVIPSVALVTAAAAIVAVGSYFRCRLVGSGAVTAVGPWS